MRIEDWIHIGRMDDFARMDSFMHRLDARSKTVVTLAFLAAVISFPKYAVSALVPFFLYPVIITSIAGIPAFELLKKALVAFPFAFFIGVLNPIMDRQQVQITGNFAIAGGWLSFASILLRFFLTVWAVLSLVACTGIFKLASGLDRLGVPRVFVVQMLFLYRYFFVVADEGARIKRSVDLRSSGRKGLSLRVYGSIVGNLLLRSIDRAERVYRSMLLRGFKGEIRTAHMNRFRMADFLFVLAALSFIIAARIWNLSEIIGSLFIGNKI